jgi:aminoglycoside phosphotransferase (APT) family kinase protein
MGPDGQAESRHGWVWAALPAECERAEVHGDAGLADLLREAGVDLDPGGRDPADAILLAEGRAPPPATLDACSRRLPEGGVLVVALGGSARHPDRWSRARRALAPPLRAIASGKAAARIRRRLRAAGLSVEQLDTGDRSRRHPLGVGGRLWRRGHVPQGAILMAAAGARPRSVLERAIADVAPALAAPIRVRGARVLASGIVLVQLDDGRPSMLRLAAGPARALLAGAQGKLASLAAADPPAPLRERVPWAVAGGDLGLAIYTLEPRLPGRHPRRLSPALWEESLDFLTALRALPGAPRPAAGSLAGDVRALAAHVDPRDRDTLARLEAALDERLADVPLGWAHGDFWPRNLLARGDRLLGVLDWDAASPSALPLLDLLHLIALADPQLKRLPHGERCRRGLWPLARAGGDARLRSHCAAAGVPDDSVTLEALAIAYWLTRVARDLRTFADRPARGDWMKSNLRRPLAELAGWAR